MKHLLSIWIFLIVVFYLIMGLALTSKAQDSTLYNYGYSLEFDSIYVVVDTSQGVSYLYDHHVSKVKFSVNGSKPFPIKDYCMVVHYTSFTVEVTRKNYYKKYKI